MDGIYCLMNSGLPLTNKLRDVLLINAYDMWENKRSVQKIKGKDYDGMIESNFNKPAIFVSMSGFIFDAILGIDKGETDVRFFVRTSELENFNLHSGKWIPGIIVETLGEDYPTKNDGEAW